jgi:hypothetical protein
MFTARFLRDKRAATLDQIERERLEGAIRMRPARLR